MSKKKQLSGKKTKLAKLPLTEVLSRQLSESENDVPAEVLQPESLQAAFSWERLEEGAAGLLTAAYVLIVQDLLSLRKEVPWASEEVIAVDEILPGATLPAFRVKEALRQAKEELSDLSRLLSA